MAVLVGAVSLACGNEESATPEDGGSPTTGGTTGTTAGTTSGGTTATTGGGQADGGGDAAGSDGGNTTVRFVAVGDTGRGDADQEAVAAAVTMKCQVSGCDFVLLLGDNFYDSGVSSTTDPQWQTKFEQPFRGMSVLFYPVLGNHDYGANGAGTEWVKGQYQVDYSAVSSKWHMPARYYHLTRGPVELFALDTNAQLYSLDAQQKIDVKAWLTASTAPWKIAYGHHPYRSNGPHGNAGGYDGISGTSAFRGQGVKDFADGVTCGAADLYLSGHDHSRQWLQDTCKGTELIVSGAGSQTTSVGNLNPRRFQSDQPGFLYVVATATTLTADFVHTSGTVDFSRTLTK